jgi:adenylate kinase
MRLIFLGSAGVGKGTYAQLVAKEYKLPIISSGQLLREELKQSTPDALKAKAYMDKGVLVPNKLLNQFVLNRLSKKDCKKGFVFDGFPRSLEQAKWLDKVTPIDLVFSFVAPKSIIFKRLSGRMFCVKCNIVYNKETKEPRKNGVCDSCGGKIAQRDDDTPVAIKKRIEIYQTEVKKVIEYYRKGKILYEIDASYNLDEVHKIIDPVMNIIDDFDTD